MKHVKLKEDVGVRMAGEVLRVDESSAKSLVEDKKVADWFDPDAPAEADSPPAPERSAPRRGGVVVTQVVEEDNPNKPATDADDTSEGDDEGDEDSADADQ